MSSCHFAFWLTKIYLFFTAQKGLLLTQNHYPMYTFQKMSEPWTL